MHFWLSASQLINHQQAQASCLFYWISNLQIDFVILINFIYLFIDIIVLVLFTDDKLHIHH